MRSHISAFCSALQYIRGLRAIFFTPSFDLKIKCCVDQLNPPPFSDSQCFSSGRLRMQCCRQQKTLNGGGLFVDLLALLLDCRFLGRLFLSRLFRSYLLLGSRLLFLGNYLFPDRLLLDSYLFPGRLFRSYLLHSSRLLFLCSFFLYNHFHHSYFALKSLSLTVFLFITIIPCLQIDSYQPVCR
jgi:hypothetical protein